MDTEVEEVVLEEDGTDLDDDEGLDDGPLRKPRLNPLPPPPLTLPPVECAVVGAGGVGCLAAAVAVTVAAVGVGDARV